MAGFNLGDIIVTIKAKTDDLQRGLGEVQSMAGKTRDFGAKMQAGLESAATGSKVFALGLVGAGTALAGLGAAGVKSAGEFEQSRIAFETMLGSADKARKMMSDIADFAKSTPFELPEVVAGSKQLLAFGFAQEQIIPTMRKLGDIASGVGVPVGQLTNVFGQVRVAGRLMGQDLLQFTNAGVPLIEALATTMKKPQNEIKKLVEQGEIGFPQVEAAINSLTSEGSKFGGMMEKQSQSFNGVVSNIKDGFGQFLRTMVGISKEGDIIQGGIFDMVKKGAQAVLPLLNKMPEMLGDLVDFIKRNAPVITGMIIGGLVPAFVSWGVAAWGAAAGMWAMFAPLIPFIAAGAAIAFAVNWLVNAFGGWGKVLNTIKPLVGFITGLFKDLWEQLKRVGELLGKELKPLFEFLSKHMDIIKKVLLAVVAVALAPLVAAFAALVVGLKVLTVVIKFIADHFEGIKKIVVGVIAVAFAPLILIIGAIVLLVKNWGKIMDWFKDVFKVVADVVVKVWQTIYNVTTAVFGAIWAFLEPWFNFLKNLFIIVFGGIALVVITVFQGIYNFVVPIFQAIWDFISMVIGWIWDRLVTAFNFWKDLVVSVFTAIWDFLSGIWNAIYGVISGVVQRIIDFFAPAFNWLLERGKDIVRGLVEGIKSVAGMVWDGIKFVADRIGKFFGGAGGWLWDTGRAIVSGLVNGIKSAAGWVNDAVSGMANSIKDKLKNSLGIHSPSKVFFEYGLNINQGLVDGLAKTSQLVSDALTIPMPNANAGLAAAGMGGGNVSNSTTSKTVITNINGPINIDSKQDADYFIKRMDRDFELEGMGISVQ